MSKLVEILLVMAILAILGTASVIGVQNQMIKASDAEIKNDLITIRNAFIQYYDDSGCFPAELPECEAELRFGDNAYITEFPCLEDNIPYVYEIVDPPHDNREGDMHDPLCPKWYKVLTNLQNTDDKSIDLIGCRRGCGKNCEYNFGVSSSNVSINENCPQYDNYACTPSGHCEMFDDPALSRCPIVFRDDPTCQDKCKVKENKCHDERGKRVN